MQVVRRAPRLKVALPQNGGADQNADMRKQRRRYGRRLFWLVAAVALLLSAAYWHLTNPVRLRAQVLAALGGLPLDNVKLGPVAFSPWGGLQIRSLQIGALQPLAERTRGVRPPVLSLQDARIHVSPWELLSGQIVPTTVEVGHATVSMCSARDAAEVRPLSLSLDAGAQQLWEVLRRWQDRLPPVQVACADLQLMQVAGENPCLIERTLFGICGAPTADGYHLRVERRPAGDVSLAELRWSAARGELELVLGWVRMETIGRLLPQRVAQALDRLELDGRVRATRLAFRFLPAKGSGPSGGAVRLAAAVLEGTNLACVIPVEDEDDTSRTPPYLRLSELALRAEYQRTGSGDPGDVMLQGVGRVRDAPISFKLEAAGTVAAVLGLIPSEGGERQSTSIRLEHVRRGELTVRGLELPTRETFPRFLNSSRVPGPIRKALGDYDPHGRVNLRLRILPQDEVAAGMSRWTGVLEPLGASCHYRRFPYHFSDARGRLRLVDGQIVLDGLTARHGAACVSAEGRVFSSLSWTGFDLTFRGRNVPLDDKLYAALPESYRQLWHAAKPLGLCDVVATLRRDDGTPEAGARPTDVHVAARLLGGSLALRDGQRLTRADGRFTVRGGVVTVHDLHGYDGNTAVRLDGRVWLSDGHPTSDLQVEVAGLPLVKEGRVRNGHPQSPEQAVCFEGRADAWGHIYGAATGGGEHQHFAVQITDGKLRAYDPDREWTDARGWVIVRDQQQEIVEFSCRQEEAVFRVTGLVPSGAADEPMTLDVRAQGAALEELLPQFVPAGWRRISDALGVTGAGDVAVTLYPSVPNGGARGQAAEIQLEAARMRATPLPLGLEDVRADVVIEPGRFELRSAAARWGAAGTVDVTGSGTWRADDVDIRLSVMARDFQARPDLVAALPEGLAHLLETLSFRGQFDALLHRVQVTGGRQRTWRFEGNVPLRGAALRIGLELLDLTGVLSGTCTVGPDGKIGLDAEFEVAQGTLDGRAIAGWRGQLRRRPGERWVELADLGGQLCDGEALGTVRIDPQTSEYELSLTLKEVSLNKLFPPPEDRPGRQRQGVLDGTVYLRGRGRSAGTRRGGGDLRIRGASFLQNPVLASVTQAGPDQPRAIHDTVDEAVIRFLWEGTQIQFQRVGIKSRDLQLVGEGTWDLADDSIDLTLWGAHPKDWPLGEFLESAGKDLIQYRVAGTLSAPTVTAEPLHKLNQTLRALLSAEQ